MDEENPVFAVWYVENHPDKELTFIGVFSTEKKAQEAMEKHLADEQRHIPNANVSSSDYTIAECDLDVPGWY